MSSGSIDIAEFIEEHVVSTADYETALKSLKSRARDLEVLPNSITVGCFRISTQLVKATLAEQLKKMQDGLLISLKQQASRIQTSFCIDLRIHTLHELIR